MYVAPSTVSGKIREKSLLLVTLEKCIYNQFGSLDLNISAVLAFIWLKGVGATLLQGAWAGDPGSLAQGLGASCQGGPW